MNKDLPEHPHVSDSANFTELTYIRRYLRPTGFSFNTEPQMIRGIPFRFGRFAKWSLVEYGRRTNARELVRCNQSRKFAILNQSESGRALGSPRANLSLRAPNHPWSPVEWHTKSTSITIRALANIVDSQRDTNGGFCLILYLREIPQLSLTHPSQKRSSMCLN